MTAAALWERLQADGLVDGDCPAPERPPSPWFVRVMLGIAGWIGAGFLLSFVGAAFAFIMDGAAPAFILGAALCGGAFALFRAFDGNDFVEQFALAISLAGQVLIGIGLGQALDADGPAFYFGLFLVEAALALAIPNFLHRVLAAAGAAVALALGIALLELHGLTAPLLCLGLALVWLEPKLWAAGGRLWRPLGYGLVLALLLVEIFRLFDLQYALGIVTREAPGWMELHGPLIGRGIIAAVLAWVAAAITLRHEPPPPRATTLAAAGAALLFGLLAMPAPGLASAMLVLLLGFAAGNRLLVALGILALFGFIGHYYYSLHATLLEKSGLLAVTGIGLIAAWFVLRRLYPAPVAAEEAADA